jgi:hypothetical protein
LVKIVLQFRLACEHNLEHFFARGLHVEQQSYFLKPLKRQALRLVHDQDRAHTSSVALEQPGVESGRETCSVVRFGSDSEVAGHQVEQITFAQIRIENKRCRRPQLSQPVEQLFDQHRLARPNFAGE